MSENKVLKLFREAVKAFLCGNFPIVRAKLHAILTELDSRKEDDEGIPTYAGWL